MLSRRHDPVRLKSYHVRFAPVPLFSSLVLERKTLGSRANA